VCSNGVCQIGPGNTVGDIVGGYIDGSGRIRGFLLHDGRYTTINVP